MTYGCHDTTIFTSSEAEGTNVTINCTSPHSCSLLHFDTANNTHIVINCQSLGCFGYEFDKNQSEKHEPFRMESEFASLTINCNQFQACQNLFISTNTVKCDFKMPIFWE